MGELVKVASRRVLWWWNHNAGSQWLSCPPTFNEVGDKF